jgi:hypothetical protein
MVGFTPGCGDETAVDVRLIRGAIDDSEVDVEVNERGVVPKEKHRVPWTWEE